MSDAAGLPALIRALLTTAPYPHFTGAIRLVQTHTSYVLLAGPHAYKIKKAVDFGFLDYRSLRRRAHFCRAEIQLNRRLTRGVYQSVVPITRDETGWHVGGPGRPVEYAVRMRRLPEAGMLDRLVAEGRATGTMMDEVADTMARFHARAAAGPAVARFGSPRRIRANWEESFAQLAPFVGFTGSGFELELLRRFSLAFMARERRTLRARVRARRIRDCHGDLRAESICFDDAIQIFDCIEFNRRFRYGDVASEIAFLTMDLTARGQPNLADRFVERYVDVTGDSTLRRVLGFYACYRATVRAKVETFRSAEADVPEAERSQAHASARHYLALACRYASHANLPKLLMTYGLSGTGKTALAEALAGSMSLEVISSDRVRKELAGLAATDKRPWTLHGGIYSRAFTRRTYAEMARRAQVALTAGHSVILDATFLRRWQRRRAARLAERQGAYLLCLECEASEPLVRSRLEQRAADRSAISDARLPVYLAQSGVMEPPTELDAWQRIAIGTAAPLAACVARVQQELQTRFDPGREAPGARRSHLLSP